VRPSPDDEPERKTMKTTFATLTAAGLALMLVHPAA
jgi:hypothetical protein